MDLDFFTGWIPGVLSNDQLVAICNDGYVEGVSDYSLIKSSALDLTLSGEAYEMKGGSVKPFGESYEHEVIRKVGTPHNADANGVFLLEAKKTYVFTLVQKFGPKMKSNFIYGQATAKSSVGRVDVLARLIVDGMDTYDCFDPTQLHLGNCGMYLEITTITFDVMVKAGTSLSQLRLFFGDPDHAEIHGKEWYRSVLLSTDGSSDGCLTVDLSETQIAGETGCAFCANPQKKGPIPLWDQSPDLKPNPRDYWELLKPSMLGKKSSLKIEKEKFYLIRSKERIALPPGVAVYCRAIDETIGEMRIHYAGFVHPYFGQGRTDGQLGTPLIFEVRCHDVEMVLTDGEKMARLLFFRMSRDSTKIAPSDYEEQTLNLSKFFAPWTPQTAAVQQLPEV